MFKTILIKINWITGLLRKLQIQNALIRTLKSSMREHIYYDGIIYNQTYLYLFLSSKTWIHNTV